MLLVSSIYKRQMENRLSNKAKNIQVSKEDAGQRLDNYLLRILKGVPKSYIYKIIRKGQVRVNSSRKKAMYKLCSDDSIRIPPLNSLEKNKVTVKNNKLSNWIIHEDENLLVVNKPPGIAVHGGSGISFGLIELARDYCNDENISLAHRIDRDTSGIVIMCKKRSTLRELHTLFRDNGITKTYLAILQGRLSKEGVIKTKIAKNILSSGERIAKINHAEGKEAISNFRVLGVKHDISFVQVKIHTGRTHQIRVQAAHLGCPIIGDQKYGFTKLVGNSYLPEKNRNLFLHAYHMSFILGEITYDFTAPIEVSMQEFLNNLGFCLP